MKKIINYLVLLLFLLTFFWGLRPESNQYDLDSFAHLPIMDEGRRKPIDTFSRNLLTVLSGKQYLRLDSGEHISANQWLLDCLSGKDNALDYKVIRITSLDLLYNLGLEKRKRYRYSYREIMPAMLKLEKAAQDAGKKDSRDRDLYDRESIKLANRLILFQRTLASFEDPRLVPANELFSEIQRYMDLEKKSIPLAVPPLSEDESWRALMGSLTAAHPAISDLVEDNNIEVNPLALRWGSILASYALEKPDLFENAITGYQLTLKREAPGLLSNLRFEVAFNRVQAFIKSAVLYLFVTLLSCSGWLLRKEGLLEWAKKLLIWTAIPHTFALIARSVLSGYPPVTNLYSSAIFIGWGAVIMGIIIEGGFKKRASGMGSLLGGVTGFCTLLIAHFLAGEGDTLEQMRAVLDTRFWLATHVTTITLGYMATFIAGVAGIVYIISGLTSSRLDTSAVKEIDRILYGTVAFALLLSFVGTVLGGLWADDSWGRFWGWDPKENGALLIVTWCAIMLHARWGRMVSTCGFAIMAVFGNIVTAWSWFGVNQLSIGLHSYGFTDSASFWLLTFCLSQILICAIGFIPHRYWKSGRVNKNES